MVHAVRRAARIAGFAGITASMLAAYTAADGMARAEDRDALRDAWLGRWSGALLRLFAVRVTVRGDVPGGDRGRIVVANHRSAIDIALLLRIFGGHMVSRADLKGWPLVGAAARKVGTVFVDRSNKMSGASAIQAMRDLLRKSRAVLVFPEGTTFEEDEVHPFHAGAFVAARSAHAEIVPVGIAYESGSGAAFVGESFVSHLERMAGATPTRVVVRIGAPLGIDAGMRAGEMAEMARGAVQALVREARAEVDGVQT